VRMYHILLPMTMIKSNAYGTSRASHSFPANCTFLPTVFTLAFVLFAYIHDTSRYAANRSNETGRPFYVMAGFRKPHAPWQYVQRLTHTHSYSLIPTLFTCVLPADVLHPLSSLSTLVPLVVLSDKLLTCSLYHLRV
jgi:hypothetical protein